MAFIKNTDLLVEGSSNVFFTGDRARQEAVENSIASGVTNKAPSQAAVQSALDLKLDSSQVGASGGVASLGEDGKIPSSQLPALALTDVHVVADDTERDALTVEEGDVAIVTGTGKTWIYDGSAWQELTAAGAVISVNGETGAVSLDSDDVPEGSSNLYFADALAQGAVVVDSSSGTETNKSMSVSAAKAYSESQASAASGAALSAAESYTDTAVSGLASESYVDTQDQAASGYAYSQSQSYADGVAASASGAALSAAESYTDSAVSGLASESYVDTQDQAASGYALTEAQSYTDTASGALAAEDLTFYKLDGSREITGNLLFSDETQNIGSLGSNRPNTVHVKDKMQIGGIVDQLSGNPGSMAFVSSDPSNNNTFRGVYFANATDATTMDLRKGRGTEESPLPVIANDRLGRLSFRGNESTASGGVFNNSAYITAIAEETFSNTARGSKLEFRTTNAGTTVQYDRLRIQTGSVVFNESGIDSDLRVEGDTDQNLLFVDAGADKVGLGTASPEEKLHVNGGVKFEGGLTVKSLHGQAGTANVITVSTSDYYIGVDCSGASKSVNLPAAATAGAGKQYIIKDESGNASSNTISILPNGAEQIDGASGFDLSVNHESIVVVCSGFAWFVV